MKDFLKRTFSKLWQSSNFNHKLTHLLHLASDDYVQRHLFANPRYAHPKRLTRHERQVYSQNGEDGIIAEIFRRIGTTNRFFVEFGVGDGLENNSALLLITGWQGLWIEGSTASVQAIRSRFAKQLHSKQLTVREAFITAENIESLLAEANVPEELDMLSVDIDGNDYWVWKAITRYRPRAVVIEYNATFPPEVEWIKAYKPDAVWDGTMAFSASLKSLELLAQRKGYVLVGCTFTGINAFFVRQDLAGDHFYAPFTAEEHYEPPRYFLQRSAGHPRTMVDFTTEP
jgi:hypothetical protein